MEGEEGGGGGECVTCTDGLSTGCYSVCGQIEHTHKNKFIIKKKKRRKKKWHLGGSVS